MATFKPLKESLAAKRARAERFAVEAEEGVPEPPKRDCSHPERLVTTDAKPKLISLCLRRLAAGEELTPVQVASLQRYGVSVADLESGEYDHVVGAPSVYHTLTFKPPPQEKLEDEAEASPTIVLHKHAKVPRRSQSPGTAASGRRVTVAHGAGAAGTKTRKKSVTSHKRK